MLDNIRENSQGKIAKIVLGFVILTFAIAGVGSYTNSVDTSVAEVNGQKISQKAFDQAYQNQKRRMQQQYGEMFDTLSANQNYLNNFRNGVLDNLINETLLDQNAFESGLRVSDERLKNTIRTMPEFQVDGKFDNNRYLALINQAGFYQSSDFRDYLKVDMTRRQLSQALVSSEFTLPYQVKLLQNLQNQTRDIKYAIIKADQFNGQVNVTDEEIKNYYQQNSNSFQTKEQAKVNYIVLDVAEISKNIEVSDEDIKTYYQENIDNYTQPAKRRLSHILVEFGDDEAKAKAKIEKILAQLNNGADFAEVAKKESDDTYSAEKGGDLEWVEPGLMDEDFDTASLALKKVNDISPIVKTSFGYHIIKLTDMQPEVIKPLADVKAEISQKVSHEKAQDKFFELQQKLAEVSFEFPDSLDDAAKAVAIPVKTSDWLFKSGNKAPFNDAKLLEAIFSETVLDENVNSDVVEVNDNLAFVVHINDHKTAKIKPMSEVKDQIVGILTARKASEILTTKSEQLLTDLKANKPLDKALTALSSQFVEEKSLARANTKVNAAIVKKAFVLPHPQEGKVSASIANLSTGDLALVQLEAVNDVKTDKIDDNLSKQLLSQLSQSVYVNYINALKADATIVKKQLKAEQN